MGAGGSKTIELGVRDYRVERVLGRGAFGKVHCITEIKTNKYYAMKVMHKGEMTKKGERCILNVLRERELLSKLTSPFIVNLWGSFQDDKNLYMVIDIMLGGELDFHLNEARRFEEETAKFYAANIILGLKFLHNLKIVHRDLKPENVLLDEKGYAHLADFNIATTIPESGKIEGFSGTRPYMAPEIFRREEYTELIDIWSLGVVVFQLLYGKIPWAGKEAESTAQWLEQFKDDVNGAGVADDQLEEKWVKKVLREKVTLPTRIPVSDECAQFLGSCLCNSSVRLDVAGCLNHKWFANIDWEAMEEQTLEPPIKPRTDRANVSRDMALREMVREDQPKSEKKLTEEQQAKFVEWDYLTKELEQELHEFLQTGGEGYSKKKRKSLLKKSQKLAATPTHEDKEEEKKEEK